MGRVLSPQRASLRQFLQFSGASLGWDSGHLGSTTVFETVVNAPRIRPQWPVYAVRHPRSGLEP
jgi:hypothetical protein